MQGEHGVVRVGFPGESVDALLAQVAAHLGPRIVASDRELGSTRDVFSAYFDGVDERLDLPVDLSLVRSDFRRSALALLRAEVGPGDVVTYGALAARVGRPRAARAVGTRMRDQPGPDHRPVPPGAARRRRRRQLRRRARRQAAAARPRGRDGRPMTPAEVGRVAGLWRYPVKSMGAEALDAVDVSWHGLAGDRRWAFVRADIPRSGFPWLTIREQPEMGRYRPSFADPARPDASRTLVRTPGGRGSRRDRSGAGRRARRGGPASSSRTAASSTRCRSR